MNCLIHRNVVPQICYVCRVKVMIWFNNKSSAVAEMGNRLATTDIGQKVEGAAVPLSVGGAESPSDTSLGPTPITSGILIHPAIWPQQT